MLYNTLNASINGISSSCAAFVSIAAFSLERWISIRSHNDCDNLSALAKLPGVDAADKAISLRMSMMELYTSNGRSKNSMTFVTSSSQSTKITFLLAESSFHMDSRYSKHVRPILNVSSASWTPFKQSGCSSFTAFFSVFCRLLDVGAESWIRLDSFITPLGLSLVSEAVGRLRFPDVAWLESSFSSSPCFEAASPFWAPFPFSAASVGRWFSTVREFRYGMEDEVVCWSADSLSPFFWAPCATELFSGRMHIGIRHAFSSVLVAFSWVTQTWLKYSKPVFASCAARMDVSHAKAAWMRISSGDNVGPLVDLRLFGARCAIWSPCLPCRSPEK